MSDEEEKPEGDVSTAEEDKTAGANLARWREYRGLTQTQVERYFVWPASRVSNLEQGRAVITEDVLTALARIYSCAPQDLLDPPPKTGTRVARGRGAIGPVEDGEGFSKLAEMLSMIHRLRAEVQQMREEMVPRLDTLDELLSTVEANASDAMRNADQLANLFEEGWRALRMPVDLRRAAGTATRRQAPPFKPPPEKRAKPPRAAPADEPPAVTKESPPPEDTAK